MRFTRRLFFVAFGLTALIAVGAYWWQLPGLAGRDGIAPIGPMMDSVRASGARFVEVPTLLWLSSSDAMLHVLCALACLASLALVLGVAPRVACVVLWASWLSLVQLGHPFLAFQWDVLLVETAFCAAFFAPRGLRARWDEAPSFAFRAVLLVLACKVTLESGIVKLTSGDPSWRDLTALRYHWWSQPLPTWTSVLIAQLPLGVQKVMCATMFVLELIFPLLVLGPRKVRVVGGLGLIALQAGLFAAGNYSFYNVLTAVIAIPALDDALFKRSAPQPDPLPASSRGEGVRWVIAASYAVLSVMLFLRFELSALRRLHTVNAYGAFAHMTKTRAEIVIEGSTDGVTWRAYEFPWKPGDVTRRPTFIAPWQPRLDWQMWFAALGQCQGNPWVLELQRKLLQGSKPVLALFETNPFPDAPPALMRTRTFEYRFAPWNQAGVWWTREETGPYCPSVSLRPDGQLQRAF